MSILLEVIVTSVHEAIEAELGGAGRLELVAALEHGGLTPTLELAREVLRSVSVPVRVMLRETASMSVSSAAEIRRLRACAEQFAHLPIDGLVVGFLKNGDPDLESMLQILAGAPNIPVTFHRAFDVVKDGMNAVEMLNRIPRIDRVLTDGGEGSWDKRKLRVSEWQRVCSPEMQVIFATGIDISGLSELKHQPGQLEVHVGRAARVPQATSGIVHRERVAMIKSALT